MSVPPPSSALAPVRSPRKTKTVDNDTLETTNQSQTSPRKKVVGCSEKLAGLRPKSPPILPPLVERTAMSGDILRLHVQRMHDDGVARKNRARNSVPYEEQVAEAPQRTYDDIETMVTRLHAFAADSEQNRQALIARYTGRYQPSSPRINNPAGIEKLTPVQLKESAKRLHTASIEHQKLEMKRCVDEYAPVITSPRLPADTISASSQRLYSSGGAGSTPSPRKK